MTSALSVENVHVHFGQSKRLLRRAGAPLRALDGVSVSVDRGRTLGIVGESGCGKTTLARVLLGLVDPTGGSVRLGDDSAPQQGPLATARAVQMVFQDPGSSLNPALTVREVLSELIALHGLRPASEIPARCEELCSMVSLPARYLDARPREMSGGQRQRVAIARALAVEPTIIVADEPTSALDVSVRAAILNLLADLREQLGMTLVFISHDLATIRQLCDEVAVMYLGRIVEQGPVHEVLRSPRHPYTDGLVRAMPRLGVYERPQQPALGGESSAGQGAVGGCRFRPRCAYAQELCQRDDPALAGPPGHPAACHFPLDD